MNGEWGDDGEQNDTGFVGFGRVKNFKLVKFLKFLKTNIVPRPGANYTAKSVFLNSVYFGFYGIFFPNGTRFFRLGTLRYTHQSKSSPNALEWPLLKVHRTKWPQSNMAFIFHSVKA